MIPDSDTNDLFFSISELNIHGVEEKIKSDQRKRFLVHFFQKIVYIVDFSEKNNNNDIFDQISLLMNIAFNLILATFLGAEVVLMSGKMCHKMTISFTDPLPPPLIFGLSEK